MAEMGGKQITPASASVAPLNSHCGCREVIAMHDEGFEATDRTTHLRPFYARYVVARAAVKHPGIEEAFATVPREPFAGPAPWSVRVFRHPGAMADGAVYIQTPVGDPAFLYQDTLIALDPARGINIGEPSLHARCLNVCAPRLGETVVQVGAGSGYYTAILACLIGQGGEVHAFEIDPDLAERAKLNLKPWPWVNVHARSGPKKDCRSQTLFM
jgi:protein-L-isoaspartate(D-aspartate) O-methyltransferase